MTRRHLNLGSFLLVALALGSVATPAAADRGYYGRGPSHFGHHHHYHGGHGLGWVPGLILGSAVLWAATRPTVVYAEPAPPPVVVVPQPPLVAPAGNSWWYYCRPAAAYYPHVQSCPVPWETVPAGTPGG
jgi:hypothetical protein